MAGSWLRRVSSALVIAAALSLPACTSDPAGRMGDTAISTGPTSTIAVPSTMAPASQLDLSKSPLLLFGPIPPMPPGADLPLPQGSADYFDLFAPGADWVEAAARVDIFKLHAWQVRHFLDDDLLREIFSWLETNDIPLMFETEPLQPPDPDECDHTESFEGPYDLEMARRIRELGGTIAVVAIEEPYFFAHKLDGPGACRYSVERIVDEVIDYIVEMRTIFPDVPVGSIEPIGQSPATTAADMETWLDTFEERSGESFAFLHIDPDWNRPDWAGVALEIEAVADARGIPFGVLYNGGLETDSRSWLQSTMEHVAEFEAASGGTPQHVAFQSWVDQPDRVLPEDDLGAFTSIINRYFGTPTMIDAALEPGDDDADEIVVSLVDDEDRGLGNVEIAVGLRPLSGAPQLHSVTGTVPRGAQNAVVAIRVNAEDASPGDADVHLSSIAYEEAADGTDRVPNSGFERGLEGWGVYGDRVGEVSVGRDDAGEPQLDLEATLGEQSFIDSAPFPVTPGAPYEFRAVLSVPEASIGTATVAVVFLADIEVARHTIRFEPVLEMLPPVTTDDEGSVRIGTDPFATGRYEVDVRYKGDIDHWPAVAAILLDIP